MEDQEVYKFELDEANKRIERLKYVLGEVIRRLTVELGHVTAEDLLEELESI